MPPAFIGSEDKCLVVPVIEVWDHYRTTKAAAKSIRNQLRLYLRRRIGKRNRVECCVLVIPENAAMNIICAALRRDRDLARLTEFSIVQHPVCANLRDGFGRRKRISYGTIAASCIAHRDAVDRCFALER